MNNAKLINQDSGKTEYGTPTDIIERARRTMGGIDLDPASSKAFNKNVDALCFYDKESNGLLAPHWHGNVWMNHPYGKNNTLWIKKLIHEYECGNVRQALCITWASLGSAWFSDLLKYPQCFLYKRPNFIGIDGKPKTSPPKGAAVTYFGPKPNLFQLNFVEIGAVKVLLSLAWRFIKNEIQ